MTLDSPPLLGFAECLQMVASAYGILITSRARETRRRAVAKVVGALCGMRANIIGFVLNQVSHSTSVDEYSYYDYDHLDQAQPDLVGVGGIAPSPAPTPLCPHSLENEREIAIRIFIRLVFV